MIMYGTDMIYEEEAPVAYRTFTDPYGDYSIRNIYYDESREFSISPSKPRHKFDPFQRNRTVARPISVFTMIKIPLMLSIPPPLLLPEELFSVSVMCCVM